jgi:hypothetical protein
MTAPVEHVVTITSDDRERLLEWLARPEGTLELTARITMGASEATGMVMIRTLPWKPGGSA